MVTTTITEPRRVVAFDPGVTTGVANGLVLPDGSMECSSFQDTLSTLTLYNYLTDSKPHYLVYERFDYRRRVRDKLVLFSRDLIGVIDLYRQQHDIQAFKYMPSEVKRYYTDSRLKDEKLYKVGKPHANDAMRHLLHWFEFGYGYQFNKKGYKPS